jgi:hypothetical protein
MKLVPFSLDLYQKLSAKGYCYFVIQNEQDEHGFFNPQSAFTFEPVKVNPEGSNSVPIENMMDLDAVSAAKYSIIYNENSTL